MGKTILSTGTRISTGVEYRKDILNVGAPSNYSVVSYQPVISVSIIQPLLMNFMGKLDRFAENDARMKWKIEKLKKKENDKIILNYYRKLYYKWILYDEIIKIVQKNINNSKRLYNLVARKVKSRLAENDDLQKARSTLLQYKELLRSYKAELESLKNEISLYMDIKNFSPRFERFNETLKAALDNAFKIHPFKNTRSSQVINLSIENIKYLVNINNNRLFPSLNFVGRISQKGNEDNLSGAYNGLKDTDFLIGFEFSYPLGNNTAKGDLKESELALLDLHKVYESTKNKYNKILRDIITGFNSSREILKLKKENMSALGSQRRTERKKYKQARLSLSFLIDTENRIASRAIELVNIQSHIINLHFDFTDLVK